MQYVGFHIEDDKSVPIAAGYDKTDVLRTAAQRILILGVSSGSIGVQEQDNLTSEDFQKLTDILNKYFAEKIS